MLVEGGEPCDGGAIHISRLPLSCHRKQVRVLAIVRQTGLLSLVHMQGSIDSVNVWKMLRCKVQSYMAVVI